MSLSRYEPPDSKGYMFAGSVANKELVGCRIVRVLRNCLPSVEGGYQHFLVLEDGSEITKLVPVGDSITIHSYEKPNAFEL